MPESIIVLKFGSSVIPSESALGSVVDEIRRWLAREKRVVAVVSAVGGATDSLLAHARSFGGEESRASAASLAQYVATGELQSAALLGLALARAGISAAVRDAASIALHTEGPHLDSAPISLDARALRGALHTHEVVVVPGFLGRSEQGETTLLGRGGSDLTAIFIAHHLAAECRLIKDVDGLYDRDPALGDACRFEVVTYDDVLTLDEDIVQHKAVRLAREAGVEFEIGCIGSERPTLVGGAESRIAGRETVAALG